MIQSQHHQTSFINDLFQQLDNSLEYRQYYQEQLRKQNPLFSKFIYNEILAEFREHCKRNEQGTLESDRVDMCVAWKMKIWKFNQFKLFTWVSVWVLLKLAKMAYQINYKEIIFRQVFSNKDVSLLNYQFEHLKHRLYHQKQSWGPREIERLKEQLQFFSTYYNSRKKIWWKFISFRLFALFGIIKTSHQCRERWLNHLNPNLKKSGWTEQQDLQILTYVAQKGKKWAAISKKIGNRTEHMIKNRFYTLKRRPFQKNSKNSNIQEATVARQTRNMVKLNIQKEQCTPSLLTINRQNSQNLEHNLKVVQPLSSSEISSYLILNIELDDYEWLDLLIERKNENWFDQIDC